MSDYNPDSTSSDVELSASSDAIEVSFALVDAADDYREIARQLRAAAEHCDVAAAHMVAGEIPRACAHQVAAQGHIVKARRLLDGRAVEHSERSST